MICEAPEIAGEHLPYKQLRGVPPSEMATEQWLYYHGETIRRRCNEFWNRRGMFDCDGVSPGDAFFGPKARRPNFSPGEAS